jgi:ABC-type glycerol-3-phosphate transport system substrate-binding protein
MEYIFLEEWKMKKVFLVVLAVLVCTGLFAGGQQSNKASNDGLTTIRVWGNNKQYFVRGGTSFTLSDWYDGTVKSKIWDKFVEELANRGIKLEMTLIMEDQMELAFQTLVASGEINNYDWIAPIGIEDAKVRYNLVDQKLLLPLDTAIEQYSDGTAKNYFNNSPIGKQVKGLNTLPDGHMYWLNQTASNYYGDPSIVADAPRGGNIRVDWLRQLNLPYPTTLDELYNTLAAFQERDANQNGIKDEVAILSTTGFDWSLAGSFGMGAGRTYYLQGNKVLSPWYQPHAQDYISFLNRLYKANLLKISTESLESDLAANKVGFTGLYWSDTMYTQSVIVPAGQPKAYFAPFVIQAFADTPALVEAELGVAQWFGSGMYCIPAKSKNVEAVVKLIDFIHTAEYSTLAEYGIEGYTFRVNADGVRERLPVNSNNVGYDMDLTSIGEASFACWVGPFPRMANNNVRGNLSTIIETGRSQGYPEGFALKTEYLVNFYENHKWGTYDVGADIKLAFPTIAEADRVAQISPDLRTYTAELMTALIIGEKSLSNWNTYMADIKRLGLDELMSIYQARMDRASK